MHAQVTPKKKTPLVSVCIPVYNKGAYLTECLQSILSQTFTDYELIIVENNSSDNSLAVAKAFASKDKRIKIYSYKETLPIGGNWNRCIPKANAKYLALYHADDIYHPRILELQVAFMEKHEECMVVGAKQAVMKKKDKIRNLAQTHYAFSTIADNFAAFLDTRITLVPPSTLYRTCVFKEVGLFNESITNCLDLEYWYRIACAYKSPFGNIHLPLVYYRKGKHQGSFITPTKVPIFIKEQEGLNALRDASYARFSASDQKRIRLSYLKRCCIDTITLAHFYRYLGDFRKSKVLLKSLNLRKLVNYFGIFSNPVIDYSACRVRLLLRNKKPALQSPLYIKTAYLFTSIKNMKGRFF